MVSSKKTDLETGTTFLTFISWSQGRLNRPRGEAGQRSNEIRFDTSSSQPLHRLS